MKIVDVNPFFYPFEGGIEHRMHDASKGLVKKGHDVTILTSRLPGTEEEEKTEAGYRILRLKSKFIDVYNPPFVSSEGVLDTLNSMDADIVNYNYRWAPSYNKNLRKYDGKKTFTYHNVWGEGAGLQKYGSSVNDYLFRSCLDTFDHIVAVSDYVRNDLISRGYGEDHVTTVLGGLAKYPDKPGSGDGDFILSLGRLVKIKGLEYLVEAMNDIDCKLIICGKGPEGKKLSRQVSREGLDDKIEIKGWVSNEEKAELMGSCKMFVMPSVQEALGIAAVELISYGRPIVCTDVGGLPATVGEGGVIIPPKDPKAIAKAVNMLLADDGLRESIGGKAAAQAELYRWEKLIPQLESVYSDVLSGKKNGPIAASKKKS